MTPRATPGACHWIRDEDGDEHHIPACYGSAINGPEACTCTAPQSRVEALEADLAAARADLEDALDEIRDLHQARQR